MLALTSCMDKVPGLIRKGENLADKQYYGYRADKWQEIEDSYQAAQANCCGKDTSKNDMRALELYCRSAKLGHKASQIEVARLYNHTAGAGPKTAIPFDRTLAHAYYSLAAEGGYEFAAALRSELDAKLTPEEHDRSRQLVTDFPNIPCELTR